MLSDCQSCNYFSKEDNICAVNPSYQLRASELHSRISEESLTYFSDYLPACSDWERSGALELKTYDLTMTRAQWEEVAQLLQCMGLAQMLPEELQLREINMIEIDSTNIEAIGWKNGTCQVDFLNGSRYQYFKVPGNIWRLFQEADSKGRFLNEVFKQEYAFEYERID